MSECFQGIASQARIGGTQYPQHPSGRSDGGPALDAPSVAKQHGAEALPY